MDGLLCFISHLLPRGRVFRFTLQRCPQVSHSGAQEMGVTMTASRFETATAGPVTATGQPLIAGPASSMECVARFEGLHTRFRSLILEVLQHHERCDPADEYRFAFLKRLFNAWQTLQDPENAASVRSLWTALCRFEAEVALAQCEVECLAFEIAAT